jgi:hypothetical protein
MARHSSAGVMAGVRETHAHPLANRNFRLLWLGENVSLLGDQFYLVALPWLVFQITGSSVAFGAVLLVAGIPRAVLLLIGGVVTDRLSPQRVMLVSNLLRLSIVVTLMILITTQAVQLWMVFVIAACFGLVDAFFYPAYRAMIPLIVEPDRLQASNATMQGASQIIFIAGPGIGGLIVARLGLALSFALDAFSFLFAAITLLLMRPPVVARPDTERRHWLTEIRAIFAYVWQDRLLAILLGVVAAINLFFTGPLTVGSAALSRVRFAGGSEAYGAMLSAFSVGILIGTVTAGALRLKRPGTASLLLVATQGVFMAVIGFSQNLALTCALWLIIGCTAGFGSLNFITLTQQRINKAMIGRFMSLIALAEVGLAPISNAIAGVIADVNLPALFVGGGVLLSAVALTAVSNRLVRTGEM